MSEHFKRLEEMYHSASINQFFKPRLKVEKGASTIESTVVPEFFHAGGSMHGSVYFKMLDDAAYFAVNSVIEDVFVVTAQFNIYFLKPVTGGKVVAKGTLIYESKSSFLGEAVLYDETGDMIARGTGSFIKSRLNLKDIKGYQTPSLKS